jgi:hypothetical protein
VHISKVKSVSLDSWTAELVAGMKEMGGNSKANEIYEAFLPGTLCQCLDDLFDSVFFFFTSRSLSRWSQAD